MQPLLKGTAVKAIHTHSHSLFFFFSLSAGYRRVYSRAKGPFFLFSLSLRYIYPQVSKERGLLVLNKNFRVLSLGCFVLNQQLRLPLLQCYKMYRHKSDLWVCVICYAPIFIEAHLVGRPSHATITHTVQLPLSLHYFIDTDALTVDTCVRSEESFRKGPRVPSLSLLACKAGCLFLLGRKHTHFNFGFIGLWICLIIHK